MTAATYGTDDLSPWRARPGLCLACGERGLCLRYADRAPSYRHLDWDVIKSSTILGRCFPEKIGAGQAAGSLGITCGCYAKFMRQLAHVANKWEGP